MVPNKSKVDHPDPALGALNHPAPSSSLGYWNTQYQSNPQFIGLSWSQYPWEQQFPNYQQPTTAPAHPTVQPNMASAGPVDVVQSPDPPTSPSMNAAGRPLEIAAGKRTRDAVTTPSGSPPRKRQYIRKRKPRHDSLQSGDASGTPQRRSKSRSETKELNHEELISGARSREFCHQMEICNQAVMESVEHKQPPPIFSNTPSGFHRLR